MTGKPNPSKPPDPPGDANSLLAAIPCPAGLWNEGRSLCLLNTAAAALFAFSQGDCVNAPRLWTRQIHPDDRSKYGDFALRVENIETPQSFDYRFSPAGATRFIWLREVSSPVATRLRGSPWKTISIYTEISELNMQPSANAPAAKLDDIIDDLFHDTQNNIHRIGMELELGRMGLGNDANDGQTSEMIKRLENSVRDLRGYISSMQGPAADCDPVAILDGLVAHWHMGVRHRVNAVWVPPRFVPMVSIHKKVLVRILERVLDFCENLMQWQGELRIHAGHLESAGQSLVEIKLTLLAAATLPPGADRCVIGEAFEVGQSDQGLRRASEVLRRHDGEIAYRRVNEGQCEIIIRLNASPH